MDDFWAEQQGVDVETYRQKKRFRERISEEAERYEGAPVEQWPLIKFNWDLRKESQKFSLDYNSHSTFDEYYPEGLCLGWVDLSDFDKHLCHFSRRDGDELWELGFAPTLAYLIVYLSEGHPISPPFAEPLEDGEIILRGGHHRYAIAKAIQEPQIPIHVEPKFKEALCDIVDIRWC